MIACWFGTYERRHSANRLLRQGLEDAGFVTEEIHSPLWEATRAKGRSYFGGGSLARLGGRYASLAIGLAQRWRARTGPPPLVVVGFGGQLDVLLAHRVCRPRAGLVFAPLVSLTETLVEDRGVWPAGSWPARGVGVIDRLSFRAADVILADTAAHASYLTALGAPAGRVCVWPLGVEPEFLAPPPTVPVVAERVLFYGRYVPLHGVDVIVAAAGLLRDRARFRMIGVGPGRAAAEAQAHGLGANVEWCDDVPLASLPAELGAAAVVLGVFSPSAKAAMVIPNKVYQAAAAARPLVTRDGPGLREWFTPDEHCLAVPAGDPTALAAAIVRLQDAPALGARLGSAARRRVTTALDRGSQAERLRRCVAGLGLAMDGGVARAH
jgi:glycosyltransferase involved in cell wall biosynthesis